MVNWSSPEHAHGWRLRAGTLLLSGKVTPLWIVLEIHQVLEAVQLPLECLLFHLQKSICCSLLVRCCLLTMCWKWSTCHCIDCLSLRNSSASSGSTVLPSI